MSIVSNETVAGGNSLIVNGETREFDGDDFPPTVAALAERLGLDPAMLVAEVNGDIVRRENFPNHALQSGDVIELVRFVGGG